MNLFTAEGVLENPATPPTPITLAKAAVRINVPHRGRITAVSLSGAPYLGGNGDLGALYFFGRDPERSATLSGRSFVVDYDPATSAMFLLFDVFPFAEGDLITITGLNTVHASYSGSLTVHLLRVTRQADGRTKAETSFFSTLPGTTRNPALTAVAVPAVGATIATEATLPTSLIGVAGDGGTVSSGFVPVTHSLEFTFAGWTNVRMRVLPAMYYSVPAESPQIWVVPTDATGSRAHWPALRIRIFGETDL
jgi:hypothetical protein